MSSQVHDGGAPQYRLGTNIPDLYWRGTVGFVLYDTDTLLLRVTSIIDGMQITLSHRREHAGIGNCEPELRR